MEVKYTSFSLQKRLLAIVLLIIFFLMLLVGRLFYLQVICGNSLQAKALSQWFRDIPTEALRGTITDRNGVVLASDVTSYDVELKESNNDTIKVEISGSKKNQDKFHVEEENGNLTINENGSSVCIGFCLDGTITIYLPNQDIAYHHKSSSGNIYSDIDLRSVVINTTSGDITLKNINDGTVSSTSGNINIRNANKLNVSATSGDISLDEPKNLVANTQSGNIKARSITSKMNITTTSGDINISSLSIKEDSKVEAKSGNINIKLDKDVFIDATTRSGNIDIDNTNTNPTLTIKTTSGDITAK